MNLATLNPKVWLELAVLAIVVAAGWYGYTWIYDRGAQSVQVKWDVAKLAETQASVKVLSAAADTTRSLAATFDSQRSTTDAQISTLSATVASAISGLRNRPDRPSPAPGSVPGAAASGPAPSCTGAQLYRPDSEFLIRESQRADNLRFQLIECQAKYTAAVKAVNKTP